MDGPGGKSRVWGGAGGRGQARLEGRGEQQRAAEQVKGQRRPASLGDDAADGGADGEGEEAERLDQPEEQPAVLGVLAHDVHLVGRGGGAGGAARGRADAHHQPRWDELAHGARRAGRDLAARIDQRAPDQRRLAADDVDQVAHRQVEQELGELRQRHEEADAHLPKAKRLREHGEHHDAHAHAHLHEEGRAEQDRELEFGLVIQLQLRCWRRGIVRARHGRLGFTERHVGRASPRREAGGCSAWQLKGPDLHKVESGGRAVRDGWRSGQAGACAKVESRTAHQAERSSAEGECLHGCVCGCGWRVAEAVALEDKGQIAEWDKHCTAT